LAVNGFHPLLTNGYSALCLDESARGACPAGAGTEAGGIGKRQDADDLAGIVCMHEKSLNI